MPATISECLPARRAAAAYGLLAAVLAAVLACAVAPAAPAAPADGAPAAGDPAPALIVPGFSGATIDLQSLRGKVVVLNFWASWCGPCRSEMPLLDALYREYRDRGVVIVGISADDRHDRKDAIRAAGAVSYITGLLADARANGFGTPPVLPLTYIIGTNGIVSAAFRANRGPVSAAQLRTAIEAQLPRAEPGRSTP